MKLQPSPTMTVDTLAAEIRRQADFHAAQDYPFPVLEILVSPMHETRGRIDISAPAACIPVAVVLEGGVARIQHLTADGWQTLVESTAEWSAAMHALGPFLLADEAEPVLHLTCACCGDHAPARAQWPNRDTGFGVCPRCFAWVADRQGEQEALRLYGEPGIHHSLTAPTSQGSR